MISVVLLMPPTAFVMGGAVAVTAITFPFILRRPFGVSGGKMATFPLTKASDAIMES